MADGKLTFDRLSSVLISNTNNHAEGQPAHLTTSPHSPAVCTPSPHNGHGSANTAGRD
jgi:hypothetical protein